MLFGGVGTRLFIGGTLIRYVLSWRALIIAILLLNFMGGGLSAQTSSAQTPSAQALSAQAQQPTQQGYYIVQFKNLIQQPVHSFLNRHSKVLKYFPPQAYIVYTNNISAFQQNEQVLSIQAYDHNFRVSPDLQKNLNSADLMNIDVALFKTAPVHQVLKQLQKLGAQNIKSQARFLRLQASAEQVKQLAQLSGVEYVSASPSFNYHIWPSQKKAQPKGQDFFMPYAYQQPLDITGFETGTRIMKFEKAWKQNLTGWQQIVGVVDSGLDTGALDTLHKDVAGAVLTGQGVLGKLVEKAIAGGSDFNFQAWQDENGHGTHVTSSIVGRGLASPRQVFRGGAYDARVHVYKIHSVYNALARAMSLDLPTNLASLYQPAYDQGVRVFNNSWGGGTQSHYTLSEQQIDNFVWENPDFVLLFSAGNRGAVDANRDGRVDLKSISAPSSAKNVISVGASENYVLEGGRKYLAEEGTLEHFLLKHQLGSALMQDPLSDNPDGLAVFSSRGPTFDDRIKPDVVAPGTNILSLCSTLEQADSLWGAFDNNYCYSGGTSMSAPLVTAAAAVVRQALQERGYTNISAALIKAILLHTADDLFPGQFGFGAQQEMLQKAPNNQQGYGRVNVAQAIELDKLKLLDEHEGVPHGRVKVYKLDTSVRKVTLVYTDAPGSPAADRALVNNLDLFVKLPSGEVLESTSTRSNIEQVVLPHSTHGVRISVKAQHIPFGKGRFFRNKQPFALVAD